MGSDTKIGSDSLFYMYIIRRFSFLTILGEGLFPLAMNV